MTTGNVTIERRGHVLLMGLDRAAKRNAFDVPMFHALARAYAELDRDDDLRAGVLFAHGDHFTAGLELTQFAPVFASGVWSVPEGGLDPLGFEGPRLRKPIVAAVQGYALAWGLEVVCMCDFIFASDQAKFGAPEIRHGSTINTLLPWIVGIQNARYLLFTGDTIDAQEAHRIGLAFRVVPHDTLADEAQRFAARLAMIPPAALRLNKAQLDGMQDLAGMRNALAYGALAGAICHSLQEQAETPDGRNLSEIRRQEGMKAFLEARDGPFRQ